MKKSIGIMGGMGPLATADLFIKITTMTRADSDRDHVRVYIDSDCAIPDRTGAILHGGEDPVPEMTKTLRNLERCGADCVLMACNTAHYFLPRLQPLTELPILDMLSITAARCAELYPGKRAAVLGTTGTLHTGIYDRALEKAGVPFLLPDEEQQTWLMHLIYGVVKATQPMQPEEENWSRLLRQLRERGADYAQPGDAERAQLRIHQHAGIPAGPLHVGDAAAPAGLIRPEGRHETETYHS